MTPDARPCRRFGRSGRVPQVIAALILVPTATLDPWLWLAGAAVALAYSLGFDAIVRPTGGRAAALTAVHVAVAASLALIAPAALQTITDVAGDAGPVAYAFVQWVALAALAVGVFARLTRERSSALLASGMSLVAATLIARVTAGPALTGAEDPLAALIGEPVAGIVRAAALATLFAVAALRAGRVEERLALVAAAFVAPALTLAADQLVVTTGVTGPDGPWLVLTAPAVLVVVGASVLAFVSARPFVRL